MKAAMENSVQTQREKILVLDEDAQALRSAGDVLAREIPSASVTVVNSMQQYYAVVADHDFDIVVLDHQLSGTNSTDLMHALKLKDYEPMILVVSSTTEPAVISAICNSGCHRFLMKNGEWTGDLARVVRQLLRTRRLEAENHKLLSKLTETNVLLEEKNKRLDEFSMTVAHDIRGPLGGLIMKLDYMCKHCAHDLDQKFRDILGKSLKSSERLMDVVQAMYEFAKIGAKAAQMSEVKLSEVVEAVVQDSAFDDKLDITIGIDELPVVWGNAELLQQMFMNLISNAVKYNDKQKIIVNVGKGAVQERGIGKFCDIFVQDNGPGIAAEDLRDVFSMFNRGACVNGDKEGIGLGLAVVQRIAELHFGKITVDSKPETGATFTITLPLEKVELGG